MKNKSVKSVTHKSDVYNIPFHITCTVSGLTKVYTSEDYINGKLDRFGGLAKLRETYVCRDAKKLRKAGKTDAEIKQILNAPKADTSAPEVKPEVKVSLAATSVTQSDVQPAPASEIAADVTPEVPAAPEAEVKTEKPKAHKDKRGWWRDEKGIIIKKANLGNYELVETASENAA